jgi:hypothetical protein
MGTFPSTPYFDSLIDDFGIWQHTDGANILRKEGYALDDATRGLLFTLLLGRMEQSEVLFSYILKSRTNDGYYGFADENRNFIPKLATDDATGQVIWAAGFAFSKDFHREESMQLITGLTPHLEKTEHVRGCAYALLGAIYINKGFADSYYKKLKSFFDNTDEDWPWPELTLTYGNAIMPYALLRYALVYGDKEAAQLGRKVLLFLEERCTYKRQRGPIGNDGWLPRGIEVAPTYSQQPIDAAYMVWAWIAAYQLSGNSFDKERCDAWMQWFEGTNIIRAKMYDPSDMRAFDGIDSWGVHYNSGAESNICLLLSKYISAENVTI